jgi:hypothetical protein
MSEPELALAYDTYRDTARARGVKSIPSLVDMLATPVGKATLQCLVLAARTRAQRRVHAAPFAAYTLPHTRPPVRPTVTQGRLPLDAKMRAAGEREDD